MKSLSQLPSVAALDEVRVLFAQNYCDQIRQIPVSQALSNRPKGDRAENETLFRFDLGRSDNTSAPKMTKSKKSRAAATAVLLVAGFEPRGMLRLIGRPRFVKPRTAMRVRVGKVTTCFYEVVNGNTRHLVNIPTRRTRRIAFFANEACGEARLLGYQLVTVLETSLLRCSPHRLPV